LSKRFQVNTVSLGAILTGRRLGTIEEFAGGHKTSIEVAKQNVLLRQGLSVSAKLRTSRNCWHFLSQRGLVG
jgi:hypothetical protein